jgi:hypothetical protein
MSQQECQAIKQQLVGTWLQEFSSDGGVICAWELLPNGDFNFFWHAAPMRVRAGVGRLTGRWELIELPIPRLKLTVTSVKSPVKRVIDVAYMGTGVVNPLVFVFRTAVKGVTDVAASKMADARFGFVAEVDFKDDNLLHLLPQDSGSNGTRPSVQWKRH